MCGIAGCFGTVPLDDERVRRTLDLMRRRGPDKQAFKTFATNARHVTLLHSRLSIIDLDDRAHQPFNIGSKWLTFNGELYNYVELRDELKGEGHVFTTQSDTEVLLRVIDAWGWEGLDKCEGMWAFAVYDDADGSLTLCRDRFGEKPLYLYRDGDDAVFLGSEVKFIAALSGRWPAVKLEHVLRFLVNGYKALYKQPTGFFNGVEELPPATLLRIERGGREFRWRYWLPSFGTDDDMSYEDAVAGARDRLIRSVELRLRADVPLAFCMSGGVDSISLISIAKRELGHDVHGFTIVNSDDRYDEQDMVDAAVAELRIRHTKIPLNSDHFLTRLRELVRHHDAPVYTVTYYVHWLLEETIARNGYRISISGTAADEMFTGYFDHHNAYLYEMRNDPSVFEESLANWRKYIEPIVRNPYLRNPCLFIDRPEERGHIYLGADEFAANLRHPWREPFSEAFYREGLLRNRMLNELFHETTPVILHEDDLNAMYFSIENRSPFLDRDLFEFCNRVPTRHLIRDGAAKAVLRGAMRGTAPDPILDSRRKVGFNAPIMDLLDTRQAHVRAYLLDDGAIYEHVHRHKIETLLDKPDLPNSESKFLFSFLAAKMFLEEFA